MEIALTQGKAALIDDADYALVSQYKWRAVKNGHTYYAATTVQSDGKQTTMSMHRLLIGLEAGDTKMVDHVDGNGLNNQRSNLRLASHKENNANRRRKQNGTSQYKGVTWNKQYKKWRAQIQVDGKYMHLAYFAVEEDAAIEYIIHATFHFGEFAQFVPVVCK